jgi:hypothetical protein
MKTKALFAVLVGGLWLVQTVAADQLAKFPSLLYAAEGAQKILQFGPEGNVVWEYPAEMARDVWALPEGHVLFCFNRDYDSRRHDNPSGVMEVTQDKKVVFSFSTTGLTRAKCEQDAAPADPSGHPKRSPDIKALQRV